MTIMCRIDSQREAAAEQWERSSLLGDGCRGGCLSPKTQEPEDHQSKPQGKRPGTISVQGQEKTDFPVREWKIENSPFLLSFVILGLSTDWKMSTHTGEWGSSLLSLLNQREKHLHQSPQKYVLPATWVSLSPVKLTYERNHHSTHTNREKQNRKSEE